MGDIERSNSDRGHGKPRMRRIKLPGEVRHVERNTTPAHIAMKIKTEKALKRLANDDSD